MIIYKITNTINKKIYIGLTKRNLKARMSEHIRDAKKNSTSLIHCAIRKYGIDNFKWEIVDTAKSLKELNKKEILYIEELNPQYNLTKGGEGVIGLPRTKEHNEKIRKALLGVKHPPERVKINSDSHKGIKRTVKSRIKQSNSVKGEKNHFYGKQHTAHTKKMISETKRIKLPMAEIKKLRLEGKTQQEIADIFKVSRSVIRKRLNDIFQTRSSLRRP